MFKVEFIEASNLVGKERAVGVLHSSACQIALASYRQNVWRHTALMGLPGYVSLVAHNWATANYAAQMELKITAPTPEHAARADQLMNGLMQGSNEEKQRLLIEHTKNCERFMERTTGAYKNILETVLKTVIILAWGSFETLVEDLHSGVLEESPTLFAHTAGKKFRFRTREAFQGTYSHSFQNDAVIDGLLKNQALDAVALIRHLLVHKSGVVDAMYKRDSGGVPLLAEFASVKIGEPIRISGKSVLNMVNPALDVGYALIEAVDAWIARRKKPEAV